ncbi:YchO/YchP family invasin [Mixta theicola]|uniref:YchO/YchP family invasin n=1 Tax=Mixta theicola TaxID=1458355 RepID=UPI00235BD220|nr:YchO/YchP family invasin [Mixta theicola]GLR09519.1 YchO family inverse autotransporter domain-containing protein [Mixta theicola]
MVLTHRFTLSTFILLLLGTPLLIPDAGAFQSAGSVPDAPFDDPARFSAMQQALPSLGGDVSSEDAFSTRLAQIAKSIGEASNNTSDVSFGQQAGVWAFNHLRDEVTDRLVNEGQSLLSPYGTAQLSLQVDMEGNFIGSGGQLLTPWQDNYQYLTFSQLGVTQTDEGLVGNAGLGQRWVAGNWLLGYNALVDRQLDSGLQRASLGTEAWSNFLRLSANYYAPLSGWRNSSSQQNRMARGYDITTQGYLPFYRQLGVSVTWEQYLGDEVDLFNSGSLEKNPTAVKVGVNYTPVPLLTFTASHKAGESGQSQDQLGMQINYRPGVALSKQLSANNVAGARSLRGSRYDLVERNNTPVLEFRQRKTLSVFLATPPWRLSSGEALTLKLQIRAANEITAVSWQGDTQALSLTPPPNNRSPQGWTVIMPAWDNTPGASNQYRLSVTLEDNKQQRVTSNWITLQLTPPMSLQSADTQRFDVMAP